MSSITRNITDITNVDFISDPDNAEMLLRDLQPLITDTLTGFSIIKEQTYQFGTIFGTVQAGINEWEDELSNMKLVNVYTNGDLVELWQNGVSLGTQSVRECEAHFRFPYQPGTLTAVAYRSGKEIGRSELKTTGKTARLSLQAENGTPGFVTIRALDENGAPVYTECGEIAVSVQGGSLLALGTADPKPARSHPFTEDHVPLYHGMALAVVKGERGAKIAARLGEIQEECFVAFDSIPDENDYVSDAKSGAADLTLGELLANEKAAAILQSAMGQLLSNPMLEAMKGMSLRKLMSMGGQALPTELSDALDEAIRG